LEGNELGGRYGLEAYLGRQAQGTEGNIFKPGQLRPIG